MPYTSPTLPPPELGSTLGSPASLRSRSPAGSYQGEVQPAVAAPPLRSRASPSARPPLPPGTSPAASQRQRRASPQRRTVRELVRAWSGGGGLGAGARSPAAATAAAALAAAGGSAASSADLEAAQPQATVPEARAWTWSQLGLSPAASPATSRRTSESAPPPQRAPLGPSQQGEVHANPVFAPFDWTAAGAGAALEGGAAGAAAGSFTHQVVKRTASRSRLSRGVSFAEPAGEGSAHGGREGGGHSRRNSFLSLGALMEQLGGHEGGGGHMSSRPSQQSLLTLHGELEGIKE